MANCTVSGCPDPRNEAEWHLRPCLHIEGVEHAEGGHHHHWPKQSQGGTEIVGFPCAFCHDRVDNADWGNKVENINGDRHWLVWNIHGEILIDKVIGEADGTQVQTEVEDAHGAERQPNDVEGTEMRPLPVPEEPSHPLKADWSGLTDEELSTEFQQADGLQQLGFLRKCKVVNTYREKHVQAWGKSWIEQAYELFHSSRRTLEAYANIYEICVTSDANLLENIGPLTDSKSLMQHIGRQNVEAGRAALEEAVAYLAEYGEPPTVAALSHVDAKCSSDLSPDKKHSRPRCTCPCTCGAKICKWCGESK